ncbi:MAG: hypothetical protein H7210_14590, partial [Pyrinomonadaceae bacterium]|nr:hypothetical protein [Phycisphaerales bacterium]
MPSSAPAAPRRRFHLNPRLLGKNWRKRTRWIFRFILGAPLLLSIVVLVLIRSPIVGYLVRSTLEPMLGCRLTHSGAIISLDGRLIVDDLSLRVPGLPGKAGEFVHARRAEVDLDWSGVMQGQVRPTGVRLFEPVFRVSQSTTTGSVNLAELHPTATTTPRVEQPPRIDVLDGSIEFGEHTPATSTSARSKRDDTYRELTRMEIAGTLSPVDAARPSYLIRFYENLPDRKSRPAASPPTPGAPASSIGMVLDGKVDLESSKVSARLLNVRLNGWPPDAVPTYLREIWAKLDIQGRMPETTFSYDPVSGPEVEVKLDGVTMSALVPTAGIDGKGDDTLKLRNVVGSIKFASSTVSAELDAIVTTQTIPSHVSLQYGGLTPDAPLHCVITTREFRLDKVPEWIVFTPVTVKENLAAFCGPTGLIDATVIIDRGPPGPQGAAELTVKGELDLSEGTAAFHNVPYPFKNITSHVTFNQDRISIDHLEGSSDSGATVVATGWIAPPNEDAEISLHIIVNDIPLDHTFAESLPASRKEAVSFLLSEEKYDAMREAKLITSPVEPAPGAQQAEPRPASALPPEPKPTAGVAPEFELGGRAQLDITVHSPPGKDSPWTYTVLVAIPRAGFLASAFAWPVNATDVQLKLTEHHAELLSGTFKGLRGGELELAAYVILETNGEPDLRPDLHVRASGIPIDDILMFALPSAVPGNTDAANGDGTGPSVTSPESPVAAALRKLKLQGTLDCDAVIAPTPQNDLALKVDLGFANLTAGPFDTNAGESISLQRLSGRIKLNQADIEIPFIQGTLSAGADRDSYGDFQLAANARLTQAPQILTRPGDTTGSTTEAPTPSATEASAISIQSLSGSLDLINTDVAAPIEAMIRLFSQEVADQITSMRTKVSAGGRVDAAVTLTMDSPDQGATVLAELHAARGLELTAEDMRLRIDTKHTSALHGSAAYITHVDSLLPGSESAPSTTGLSPATAGSG